MGDKPSDIIRKRRPKLVEQAEQAQQEDLKHYRIERVCESVVIDTLGIWSSIHAQGAKARCAEYYGFSLSELRARREW